MHPHPPVPPTTPPTTPPTMQSSPSPGAGQGLRHSIAEFVHARRNQDRGHGLFELESDRLLEVNLRGAVWTKTGSMVAYVGSVKFTREGVFEHGIGKFLKRAVSGEGTQLTKAEGAGRVYLADNAKKITILGLQGDDLFVNGNDVLAFEPTLQWDVKMMRKMVGMLSGGLFNLRFTGTGMLAITTHFEPLALEVRPGHPVYTDPNATVAWSGSLAPTLNLDASFGTFIGRGSGESLQMKFEGQGFVIVQPMEELYFQRQGG